MKKLFLFLIVLFFCLEVFAWQNYNFRRRYPVTDLNITVDLNYNGFDGNVITIQDVNFNKFNLDCADLNDFRVYDENTGHDLNRTVQGTKTSVDGNVSFEIDSNISKLVYHGRFYFYTKNSACSSPPNFVNFSQHDTMEDNNLLAIPDWTQGMGANNSTYVIDSVSAFEGTRGLDVNVYSTAGAYRDFRTLYNGDDYNFDFWTFVKIQDVQQRASFVFVNGDLDYIAVLRIHDSKFQFRGKDNLDWNFSSVPSNNTWYRFRINWSNPSKTAALNTAIVSYYIYDAGGKLIDSNVNGVSYYGKAMKGVLLGNYRNNADTNIYWDYVGWTVRDDLNISFNTGLEETAPPQDSNIVSIDGISDTLPIQASYVRDQNLSVRFFIFDGSSADNNFNMWYGATQGAKTTQIIGDVNLSSRVIGGICDSDINGVMGTYCVWDWNLFGVADGNWFITTEVNDGFTTDSNSTEFTAGILIDNTAPTYSVDWNGNYWSSRSSKDQNIFINTSDAKTDVNSIAFRLESGNWSFVNADLNVLKQNDGNFLLEWFVSDLMGNTTDTNSLRILVDKTTPVASRHQPASNTTSPSTTFSFSFNVDDNSSGSPVVCDYNVQVDHVALIGYLNQSIAISEGKCSMNFSISLASGQVVDVNAMPKDSANTGMILQSFSVTYAPASPPPPSPPGGSGGGGKKRAGISEFCISDADCELDLYCLEFSCVKRGVDFNGVLVFPNDITSSPFQDVLPNYQVVLPDIIVANYSDALYVIGVSFACTEIELCAADWCEVESEFDLQPRGQKVLKSVCTIPSNAKIGKTYSTQLIVLDKASGLKKGVSINIPVRQGNYSEIITSAFFTGSILAQFFDWGVVCFGSQSNCLFSIGNQPVSLGFVSVDRLSVPLVLCIVFLFSSLFLSLFGSGFFKFSIVLALLFFFVSMIGYFV